MSLSQESGAAILFHRIGPYHHARLEAASKLIGVVALQGCSRDKTYDWAELGHEGAYPLETLFPDADSEDQPASLVRQRVFAALDRVNPRVVVVPGWAGSLASAALSWCQSRGVPAIGMSESQAIDEPRSIGKEFIKRQIVRLFSSALVGSTPHVDYITQLGMPHDRIFLGYDAVDNRYFRENAEKLKSETLKEETRRKYGLPEKFFLASARFVEKKNLPRLLQAYALYRQNAETRKSKSTSPRPSPQSGEGGVPWSLVLLGDGSLKSDLCRLISDLSLQHSVLLPGFKQYDELPVYYGLASAFVHASTTEQWGLVVNEAMASGLPVLVSNRCGCAPDLVQEGVNGFTFDPYNVEQLAQLMLKLSTMDRGEHRRLAGFPF